MQRLYRINPQSRHKKRVHRIPAKPIQVKDQSDFVAYRRRFLPAVGMTAIRMGKKEEEEEAAYHAASSSSSFWIIRNFWGMTDTIFESANSHPLFKKGFENVLPHMQDADFPAPAQCEGCPRSARTLSEAVAGGIVQRAEDEGKVMLRGALSLVLSLCIQRKNNRIEKDCF